MLVSTMSFGKSGPMIFAVEDSVLMPFATSGAPQAMCEVPALFVRWGLLGSCT